MLKLHTALDLGIRTEIMPVWQLASILSEVDNDLWGWYIVGLKSGQMLGNGRAVNISQIRGWYIVGLKSGQMLSNISHLRRRCYMEPHPWDWNIHLHLWTIYDCTYWLLILWWLIVLTMPLLSDLTTSTFVDTFTYCTGSGNHGYDWACLAACLLFSSMDDDLWGWYIVNLKSGWMLGNGRALVFMGHLHYVLNYKLQTTEMYI